MHTQTPSTLLEKGVGKQASTHARPTMHACLPEINGQAEPASTSVP